MNRSVILYDIMHSSCTKHANLQGAAELSHLPIMTVPLYAPTDDCLRDIPEFIESPGSTSGQSVALEEAIRQRNQRLGIPF